MTKLIILRGPSGVGKSTVAGALMKRTKRPTMLVDLDHYRFSFVNAPKGDHDLEYKLSAGDILIGLESGFDVIFDGNFTAKARHSFLEKLFGAHPEENYIFYLNASLDETLRRHESRADPRIEVSKMKEVYDHAAPIGHADEVIIPEDSSLEQTVAQIRRLAGM